MRTFPPTLWYENKAGKRWIPKSLRKMPTPPKGFIYQHSRFPMYLHDSICTDKGQIAQGSSSINEELVCAMIGLKRKPGRLTLSAAMFDPQRPRARPDRSLDEAPALIATDPPYAFGGTGDEHAISATVATVLREAARRLAKGRWMLVMCAAS
jgi:hypothetical protein